MTDEIVDGTKAIKRTTERTVEERMQALPSSGGRGDLERPIGAYRNDELFVVFIGMRTTGEGHSDRSVAAFSSEEAEEVIRFQLELPVRPDHLGIAMSASRLQVPLAHHGGRRRPNPECCAHVEVVPHLRPAFRPSPYDLTAPGRPGHRSGSATDLLVRAPLGGILASQLERTRPSQSRPGLGGRRQRISV